ncbi:MAG: aspartate aminotransferase family protein [bacterium]|nr:aspartate aminotransferase family protein [bacterium]
MITEKQVFEQEKKFMVPVYKRIPVCFVKGAGIKLWDINGKEYLDFFGQGVNGIGHCHPKLVKAITEQANKLIHFSNLYYTIPQVELAKKLSEVSFGGKVFFANSGAEANEAAIKLARIYGHGGSPRCRYEIITTTGSFHGRTLATLSATGQEKIHKGFEPLVQGFKYVPFNDLEQVEKAVTPSTCAILVEPIQGEGGVNVATPDYLKGLRKLCDEQKILLILDEVQTGLGRCGKMFGYEHYEIIPDIITLAKWLGSGIPIGAMIARPHIADLFLFGSHASTFGGNPLACAATLAVINVIIEENLVKNARENGQYLMDRLSELKYSFIKEVRGKGLMVGLELEFAGGPIVESCLQQGLIVNCTVEKVLRFLPPLIVTKQDIDQAIRILDNALQKVGS